MKKIDFVNRIESICSSSLQEEWDNCGYQINTENEEITKCLICLEVTNEVIEEAIKQNADFILTHHPLIFGGKQNISYDDYTGKLIIELVKHGISVYSCHTSFDIVDGGNNDYLGEVLGFDKISKFDAPAFCRKGELAKAVSFSEFINLASEKLGVDKKFFKFVGSKEKLVKTACWCTGSGSEFVNDAIKEGVDLFITGDFKYHDAQTANAAGICVLDAGHYGTEKIFEDNMLAKLGSCGDLELMVLNLDINPFS